MEPRIRIRQLDGMRLLGTARTHSVVLDRPPEEGGTDVGFTSSEMLLLAIGSCATGSLRNFLEERGTPSQELQADVFFEPTVPGARDRVVIALQVPEAALAAGIDGLKEAITSGGVTSRMKLGSEIDVRYSGMEPPCNP